MRIPGLRPLILTATAVLMALGVLDTGSIVLTRIAVPDQVREAGYAATEAVGDQPITRQTAQVAYRAAREQAATAGNRVHTKDFALLPDGRVHLTAGRNAPTLLVDRIPQLRHLTDVTASATVARLPYS